MMNSHPHQAWRRQNPIVCAAKACSLNFAARSTNPIVLTSESIESGRAQPTRACFGCCYQKIRNQELIKLFAFKVLIRELVLTRVSSPMNHENHSQVKCPLGSSMSRVNNSFHEPRVSLSSGCSSGLADASRYPIKLDQQTLRVRASSDGRIVNISSKFWCEEASYLNSSSSPPESF